MKNSQLPAFPAMDTNNRNGNLIMELRYEGLTKREYFAAMAMQGLCHSFTQPKTMMLQAEEAKREYTAAIAVELADHLLKQLETPPKP